MIECLASYLLDISKLVFMKPKSDPDLKPLRRSPAQCGLAWWAPVCSSWVWINRLLGQSGVVHETQIAS